MPKFLRLNYIKLSIIVSVSLMEAIRTLFESLWYQACLSQVSGFKIAFGSSFLGMNFPKLNY